MQALYAECHYTECRYAECRSAGYSCEKSKERIFKKILKLKGLSKGALTLIG